MIALVPADAHLPDLAVDGGLDPSELHLTLAYLGDDVTSWPPENQQAVLDQARMAAQSVDGLVMARVFGHALFNPDGGPEGDRDPCSVYLVGDSRVLDALQQTVAVGLAGKDGVPEQHPNFFPHITATGDPVPGQLSYTGAVVFDRLRVALGDDVTDIPLGPTEDITYVGQARARVVSALGADNATVSDDLADLYTLLALATGTGTTLENIHDAWSIATSRTNPDHPALVPFSALSPDVQALDEPFLAAVRHAASPDPTEDAVTAAGDTPQYVDVRVTSRGPGDLAAFVQLCQTIAQCCGYGASRDITVSVDGDGSADLRFDFGDSDVSGIEPLDVDDDLVIGIGG